jgi:uncharacterized membrane protein HdeD (DUF308 family)
MMATVGMLWLAVCIAAFAQPAISARSFKLLVGTVMVVEGILAVVNAAGEHKPKQARWAGFIGIAMGVLAFWIRSISAVQLIYYVACWAIASGAIEMIAAIRQRKHVGDSFWFVFAGLAALAFGSSLLLRAGDSLHSAPWIIGTCAVPFAIILFTLTLGAHACMTLSEAQPAEAPAMRPHQH